MTVEGFPFNSVERTRTIETSRGSRVEVLERSGPGAMLAQQNPMTGGPGSYRLTLEGGQRMIGVDTVKREYFEMNAGDMAEMASSALKMMSSMNMTSSGMVIDATDLGDGGMMLGHPTSHWKMHQTMTTSVPVEGDTIAMNADMFIDTWFAKDIAPIAATGAMNSTTFALDSATMKIARGFLGGDSAKISEVYKRMPKTLPMKVVTSGSIDTGPMDMIITTTREITRLERGKFDAVLFKTPAGYKLVERPMPKLPANTERSPDKLF